MREMDGAKGWGRAALSGVVLMLGLILWGCGPADTGPTGGGGPPEPAVITFEETYGGAGSDIGYSMLQTADGGYVIAGSTKSSSVGSTSDVYLIKVDAEGEMVWQKSFGEDENDSAFSVQPTTDGGYIIAGETYSFGAGVHPDVYLIKTNALGELQWQKTYGGDDEDSGYCVRQTTDGGFIIAGRTWSFGAGVHPDVYLIRTDGDGDILWEKTFGEGDEDAAYSVQNTADGGFILTGETFSFGVGVYSDLYLIKTDAAGQLLWQKTFGGTENDCGFSVNPTADGGFIIAGETFSFGAGTFSNAYLVKTDANGVLAWQKTLGGTRDDTGRDVLQLEDGGYVLAGGTFSFGAGSYADVYLVKTDSSGSLDWQKTFGGSRTDFGYSVLATDDDGFAVLGESNSYGTGIYPNVYLIKTDADGNLD